MATVRQARECSNCFGPVGNHNTSGICTSNPACAELNRLVGRERERRARRERMDSDPDYRALRNSYKRTPGAKRSHNERQQSRYASDPAYRSKRRKYARDRYATDPDYRAKVAADGRRWRATIGGRRDLRAAEMLTGARDRARKDGFPFDLTVADVLAAWFAACPYCGDAFGPRKSNTCASLDKIVPALGYVAGNIVVVCNQCNWRKGDMAITDLRNLADAVEQVQRKLRKVSP